MTTVSPVGPSATVGERTLPSAPPSLPTPPTGTPLPRVLSGAVGPLGEGSPPCFADRYPCEVYDFALEREGPIAVTLTWDGEPRALMVQLYWAGDGLAHEDVAPRTGPSRISFMRPRMEPVSYRLRVVSLEPGSTIPFSLTLTY